jgi:hypothetical protein
MAVANHGSPRSSGEKERKKAKKERERKKKKGNKEDTVCSLPPSDPLIMKVWSW